MTGTRIAADMFVVIGYSLAGVLPIFRQFEQFAESVDVFAEVGASDGGGNF